MFESIGRSFKLIGESFRILGKNKKLLLFPLLSGIISITILILFAIPLLFKPALLEGNLSFYSIFFALYLLLYFVGIFFNAGLIFTVNNIMKGRKATFQGGINAASKRVHRIFIWALISATVGLIINIIGGREDSLPRKIVAGIIGAAWNVITFFVVPVIILEKKGVKDSARRSIQLFKNAWGEEVVGQFSIMIFFVVLILFGFFPIFWIGLMVPSMIYILIAVLFVYVVALLLIAATIDGIYKTALYNYASGNKVAFSDEFMKDAFKRKGNARAAI